MNTEFMGKRNIRKNKRAIVQKKSKFSLKKIFAIASVVFFSLAVVIFFSMFKDHFFPRHTQDALSNVKALEALKNRLIHEVNTKDPKQAMNDLKKMLGNDAIANECHGLTHFIGNAAYKKYKDVSKAVSYYDEMCGAGYIHGVIEQKFADITSDAEMYQALSSICAPDNLGICFHGVGHGLMWYSSDDLYKSLASCDNLQDQYQINNCYDGVFMENFEGDKDAHPTTYENPQNPSYPCNQVEMRYKESCYFYSARYYLQLYPKQYNNAFTWCQTVETVYQLTCIKGVGSAMMKQNLNKPNLVAAYCNQTLNSDEKTYCLDGMVSYYLTNYYSIQKGMQMCEALPEEDKNQCIISTQNRQNQFPQ